MKKMIIASAFAIAAAISFAPATQAANLTIQLGDSHRDHHGRDVVIGRDHDHHRDHDRHHDRVVRHHDSRHHCRTKKVITHHHGKRVVRETKVCG